MNFQSKPLLNCRVDIVDNYSEYLADKIESKIGQFVVTINPEISVQAYNDKEFAKIINSADLIIPDGVGITLHYLLRFQKVQKKAGIEVCYELMKILNSSEYQTTRRHSELDSESKPKVVIIGSTGENISKAKDNLQNSFPNLEFQTFDGYFNGQKEILIQKKLQQFQPDLILVGLGSPKQENWIIRNRHLYSNSTWIGVGGSFDIWSGYKSRAPKLMISLGLEWLYRLYQEPCRFTRMLVLPWFLWLSVKEIFLKIS